MSLGPIFGPRNPRLPPAVGLRAPEEARPNTGPKWPKITKNGTLRLSDEHQRGLVPLFMDRIHSGNVWAAFLSCFNPFSPSNGVC